jgi:MoaA/NifB/PqqE/SkfB family radical SAM enzyme
MEHENELVAERAIKLVSQEPEISSISLAKELDVTLQTIRQIYEKIKGKLPPAIDRTFGHAEFFHKVLVTDVLSDADRLSRFKAQKMAFPDNIELHLGLSCQCACVFCWRWAMGRRQNGEEGLYKRKSGRHPLTLQQTRDLLDEFIDLGGRVAYLSGGLEFFTRNIAKDVVSHAAGRGLRLRVYSNGISPLFSDEDMTRTLLETAESIRFSLHANDPETYARVQMPHRKFGDAKNEFDKVRRNIENILKIRTSSAQCQVYLAFLLMGEKFLEIEDALEYWKEKGLDSLDIRNDMMGEEAWFTRRQERELEEVIARIREKRNREYYSPMKVTAERQKSKKEIALPKKCYIPFKKPAVDPWGDVFACCYGAHPALQHPQYYLGTFPTESLRGILSRMHRDGIIPRPHCAQCTDWEVTYNQCVEKVLKDWRAGIEPRELPFQRGATWERERLRARASG